MCSFHIARKTMMLMALFAVPCSAQVIRGIVEDGTTGKPAAGDQVVLLAAGVREEGRFQTGNDGTFIFPARKSEQSPTTFVVRVIHDGVRYDQPVPPSLDLKIKVYDSSQQVNHVDGYMSILQFQARETVLEVTELHAVRNDSVPPATQVDPHNFELSIPEGTRIKSVAVAGPTDEPLEVIPISVRGEPGRYEIPFPLKPGLTKYAVTYDLSYRNKLTFRRKVQYPTKQFSVVIPNSMRLTSSAQRFRRIVDQEGMQVHILNRVRRGQDVAFGLSGIGVLSHSLRPVDPHGLPSGSVTEQTATPKPGPYKQSESAVLSHSIITGSVPAWLYLAACAFVLGSAIFWAIHSRKNGKRA